MNTDLRDKVVCITGAAGEAIGVQSRAHDDVIKDQALLPGDNLRLRTGHRQPHRLRAQPDLPPGLGHVPGQ